MFEVAITDDLRQQAVAESSKRYKHSMKVGYMDHTTKQNAEDIGCIVELAFARATGWEWKGFNYKGRTPEPDVGPCEVRGTTRRPPVLYFKDFNDPDRPYVLGHFVRDNLVQFLGWRFGWECCHPDWRREARNPENMRPNQKCWWEVPAEKLWGFRSLWHWAESHGFEKPRTLR